MLCRLQDQLAMLRMSSTLGSLQLGACRVDCRPPYWGIIRAPTCFMSSMPQLPRFIASIAPSTACLISSMHHTHTPGVRLINDICAALQEQLAVCVLGLAASLLHEASQAGKVSQPDCTGLGQRHAGSPELPRCCGCSTHPGISQGCAGTTASQPAPGERAL